MIVTVNGADKRSIWIGFDPRQADGYAVTRQTVDRYARPIPSHGLVLSALRHDGLYTRPTETRDGRLFDVISDAPMSTEFAISRFLVPHLAGSGWALFMDSDMMVMSNLAALFQEVSEEHAGKAVVCVKHHYQPAAAIKMDNQVQTAYPRKNWSSFMFFNCEHPANRKLTPHEVNARRGRDLHGFCWLADDQIGGLDERWNYLVGYSTGDSIANAHFTEGLPSVVGGDDHLSALWRAELEQWAS